MKIPSLGVLHLAAYYYYGHAVLILSSMEKDEEMAGRHFNSFEELKPLS